MIGFGRLERRDLPGFRLYRHELWYLQQIHLELVRSVLHLDCLQLSPRHRLVQARADGLHPSPLITTHVLRTVGPVLHHLAAVARDLPGPHRHQSRALHRPVGEFCADVSHVLSIGPFELHIRWLVYRLNIIVLLIITEEVVAISFFAVICSCIIGASRTAVACRSVIVRAFRAKIRSGRKLLVLYAGSIGRLVRRHFRVNSECVWCRINCRYFIQDAYAVRIQARVAYETGEVNLAQCCNQKSRNELSRE